jgi:hypothetical protein
MEVLEFLNKKIREEHGNKVTIESKWTDAGIDSFGSTMVLCDMDAEYGCFDKEWFNTTDFYTLTIQDIVERVINESPKLQVPTA